MSGANAFASFLDRSAELRGARDLALASWTVITWAGEIGMLFPAAGGMTAIWVIVPHIRRNVPKGAIYWEAIRSNVSKYRTLQRATWLGGFGMALALLHIVL